MTGGKSTDVFDRAKLRELAAERIDEPRRGSPEGASVRVPELVRCMREIENAAAMSYQRGDLSEAFAMGMWTALAGIRHDFGIEDSRYVDTGTSQERGGHDV